MNPKHLGDAFDHWKGSVLELVGNRNMRVVPMFTDEKKWNQKQLKTYAKLLRLDRENILKTHEPFSNSRRNSYFDTSNRNDLFLDPDIGICINTRPKKEQLAPSDIAALLANSRSRMLMIYQHKWVGKMMKHTLKLVLSIKDLGKFHRFAYNAGAVSMVFISRDQKRIAKASECIGRWLGPVASARIIQ